MDTITIRLRHKKARKVLESLEALKVIEIVDDKIPAHWPAKKKKQAAEFPETYGEAKMAERGEIKLKTADELIAELQVPSLSEKKLKKKNLFNKQAEK